MRLSETIAPRAQTCFLLGHMPASDWAAAALSLGWSGQTLHREAAHDIKFPGEAPAGAKRESSLQTEEEGREAILLCFERILFFLK